MYVWRAFECSPFKTDFVVVIEDVVILSCDYRCKWIKRTLILT